MTVTNCSYNDVDTAREGQVEVPGKSSSFFVFQPRSNGRHTYSTKPGDSILKEKNSYHFRVPVRFAKLGKIALLEGILPSVRQ